MCPALAPLGGCESQIGILLTQHFRNLIRFGYCRRCLANILRVKIDATNRKVKHLSQGLSGDGSSGDVRGAGNGGRSDKHLAGVVNGCGEKAREREADDAERMILAEQEMGKAQE